MNNNTIKFEADRVYSFGTGYSRNKITVARRTAKTIWSNVDISYRIKVVDGVETISYKGHPFTTTVKATAASKAVEV